MTKGPHMMNQDNKGRMGWGLTVFVLAWLSASLAAVAADTNAIPGVWLADTSESDNGSLVSFPLSDPGRITIAFAAQSGLPSYVAAAVIADAGIADSPFSGDYTAAGAMGVSFRIMGDGHVPRSAAVMLTGQQSGRRWYNSNVAVSSVAGEWTTNSLQFDLAAGWVLFPEVGGDVAAMWQQDLQDVGMIGVSLVQNGVGAQSYTLDEFRLVGEDGFITPPAGLSPLEQALADVFGGKTSVDQLTDEERQRDSNANGMTDVYEILSENDPAFANSIFVAEIAAPSGEMPGVTVKWASVKFAKYTVYRSEDLLSVFHTLADPGSRDIDAFETGYMTYQDTSATGEGPYFYKILKK